MGLENNPCFVLALGNWSRRRIIAFTKSLGRKKPRPITQNGKMTTTPKKYNVLRFLEKIRDSVEIGEDRCVSVFLMGNEIRIRIDLDLGTMHLAYTVSKPVEFFAILNEDNEEQFFKLFSDEVNSAISEWEVGEK